MCIDDINKTGGLGLYLKLQSSESNKAYFTDITSNVTLHWDTCFPLYISSMRSSVNFCMGGAIFGDYSETPPKDDSRFFPWELINFTMDMKELEDKPYGVSLRAKISNCVMSKEFENFMKKSKDPKQLNYFKVIFKHSL